MAPSTLAVSGSAQTNWRGIMLSQQQERELAQYCLSKTRGVPYGRHGKQFWVEVSRACPALLGRPYSWQSCRRCALAWEGKNELTEGRPDDSAFDGCDSDSRQIARSNRSKPTSDALGTPSEGHGGPQTPQPDDENSQNGDAVSEDEANEDDMLPEYATPLLNRSHNLSVPKQLDSDISKPKISAMAASWLANWENEVKNITGILEENQDPVHQKRILRAFTTLQKEMQASIQRYDDRTKGDS